MPRRNKPYLVTFEFQAGEPGVPFCHTVMAATIESATRKAERFLKDFYGPGQSEPDGYGGYYYLGGEVHCSVDMVDLIESLDQLVKRLSL